MVMSRLSKAVLMCMAVVLSTSLVVTEAQDGGRASVMAATNAANADVRARALEVNRMVLAAAAAEKAVAKNSGKPIGQTATGGLGVFEEEIMENDNLDLGTSVSEGDTWMSTEVDQHYPVPTPTPTIEMSEVVWTTCAAEGELCDCGYQRSSGVRNARCLSHTLPTPPPISFPSYIFFLHPLYC